MTGEGGNPAERITGTVRIGLLGTLAVHDEAGQPVRLGGHRVRMLLILLAVDAGRVVPAYSLIERLWDTDPPGNAANSLQSAISRLRACLREAGLGEDVIESHPGGYRLAVSPHEIDAVAFENLARAGSQALASGDPVTAQRVLAQALSAWRGPALADATGMEFAAGPAARLEESRTRASLDLIEAGLALGETDGLIGDLRAMIAADPMAERPRGLLMRALYAAGRQAEALAVYTQTRELLADRLGVDPSPQLEQIYLGVLRQDLPPARRRPPDPLPPHGGTADGGEPEAPGERLARGDSPHGPRGVGVRKPLTSFVGRDEDLARVRAMLARGRLVTLTGPGGAGKTRLAIELAALLADDPATRSCQVWFVDLTPVTDPGEVPYAVQHALGIRDSPMIARAGAGQAGQPTDPAQRLAAALAHQPHLLILDNCEHVVAAVATLAEQILAGCPAARVLATSREPLRIGGEALWPVPPLPVPPVAPEPGETGETPMAGGAAGTAAAGDSPAAAADARPGDPEGGGGPVHVADYAAVRLLADRAAAVRPDFRVDAANAADVARICRALDGMPLAIELAAARLRTLSPAQLAGRLDARFELLTGGSRTAAARHQTLRAVVDWSWELLSRPEQVLARRLAAFGGGTTLAAAEQVCTGGTLPADDVLPAMFGLVEKSFLAVDNAGDHDPRYRMLETVRAYCAQRLADSGEEHQARHAFATHFLRLAETADPLLRGAEQQAWMRRLTAEQDNVHAALRWAVDSREVGMALRFGQALGWFWLLRAQRRESAAMAREILAISETAPPTGPGRGDVEAVCARAVCALITLNANWDLDEVREPLLDAEALVMPGPHAGGAEVPGDRPSHPLVVVAATMVVLYERRDPELAVRLMTAHFGSADPWTRSGARLMHAFFSMSLGRMDEVAGTCAEALAGFRALGDRWGAAMALTSQAELAALDGDHAGAIAALEEALRLSRDLTDWEDIAQMHANLAKSRSRLGDRRGALADLDRAERVARAQGDSDGDLWISHLRADLAWLHGDVAQAGDICQRLERRLAAKPAAMIWNFQALIEARHGLAQLRLGDVADGRASLAAALRHARDSQDRTAVAAVMDALAAALLWTQGGRESAERAAAMLGAAHAVRGAFDHSSLDAPSARELARGALGEQVFETAYSRARELGYGDALALAEGAAAALASR